MHLIHLLFSIVSIDSVEAWMETGGYVVLFGLLCACGLGFPLPEDIPLLASGVLVADHKMHLAIAAATAWCGILAGDMILYHLGKKFGLEIVRVPFVGKHVTRERIEKAERLFERYGIWVVAVGRMIAGVRGAMVVAAGAIRFNFLKFIITDALAAIVSGGLFLLLGYWLGSRLHEKMRAIRYSEHLVTLAAVLLVVLAVLIVWGVPKFFHHKKSPDSTSEQK
ncbi:MAG TPA: DedA family protein [Tepidisphaeraceae bacterium]|nr:DedA family protein [Tepidisphaeraceae bacterium]